MPLQSEIAILIAALYIFECALLLYSNEAVIECSRRNCRALFPSERANFCGRLLYILNPIAPTYAYFRVMWRVDSVAFEERGDFSTQIVLSESLRVLAPFVVLISVLVLIGLPIWLIFFQICDALPLLLLTYGAIAALLIRLWLMRAQIAMSSAQFMSLAFQCIACPPLASNIVRAISLASTSEVDLLAIAKANFSTTERRHVYTILAERVVGRMVVLEPEAPEFVNLAKYLAHVRQELSSLDDAGQRRKLSAPRYARPRKKGRRHTK